MATRVRPPVLRLGAMTLRRRRSERLRLCGTERWSASTADTGGSAPQALTTFGRRASARWVLLPLAVLFAGVVLAAGQRGVPPQEGIGNFGKIDDRVYRGAQPDEEGIRNLKRLGIKTIINLRMTNDVWKVEPAAARANGILYTNVPMFGLGRPKDDRVRQVLAILESAAAPVFIHCEHGCDRTGTVIACYRIKHDGWSSQAALQEAAQYGLSKLERGMKNYVIEFEKARR
jgi:tyrosine-protein phosphatase SIW14